MAAGRWVEVKKAERGTSTAILGLRRFRIDEFGAEGKVGHSDNESKTYNGRLGVVVTLEIDNDLEIVTLLGLTTATDLSIIYRGDSGDREATFKNARFQKSSGNIPGIVDRGETGSQQVQAICDVASTDTPATMVTYADV
jgi:hypothetical protein